jgi:hypothetical protein
VRPESRDNDVSDSLGRTSLNAAYGEWLDTFTWHWFATLTFRLPPSSRTSLNHFRRFARDLGRLAERGPGYFVGSETGGLHGREHLHALLYFPPPRNGDLFHTHGEGIRALRSVAWKWWFDRYGRALILDYDPGKGASHYVTKYCTKTLADWDIGGNLEHHVMVSTESHG